MIVHTTQLAGWRLIVLFAFFGGILATVATDSRLAFAELGMACLGMIAVPCSQRLMHRGVRYGVRQAYFAAAAALCCLRAFA